MLPGAKGVVALAILFAQLSLLAVGGVSSALPEMQRQVTITHGWMSGQQFAALYALAQAAPGPNMLIATLVGWQVAGLAGAVVATLALCGPSGVLCYFTASAWHRFRNARWRRIVQAGLTPVTVGLVMAAAILLIRATSIDAGHATLTALCTAGFLFTRIHPLLVLAVATAIGAMGIL